MRRRGSVFKVAMLGLVAMTAAKAETPLAISHVPPLERQLIAALSGRFDTQRQYLDADPSLKVAPSAAGIWLDRQYARMTQIDAPALGNHVLFLEWRRGGPRGPVSRQRIWTFDRSGNDGAMAFYALKHPVADAAAASMLKPDDLVGYPEACLMRWTNSPPGWQGRIDPTDCRIVAQSGRGMRLDVTIRIERDGFTYQDAGILDSGVKAFAVPPTVPYRFRRVAGR